MLKFVSGDIFQSGADALVNPVNAMGASGKGLALAFKRRFPVADQLYRREALLGRLGPGGAMLCETSGQTIIFVATKADWRDLSRLEWVETGVAGIVRRVRAYNSDPTRRHRIASLAVPALGCGLGGLAWDDVRPLIEVAHANASDLTWLVYPPQ